MSDEKMIITLKCLASGYAGSLITTIIFAIIFEFLT